MKKVIFGLILLSAMGSLSACKDSSKIPAPEVTSVPLILPRLSSDPAKTYFDTQRANVSINRLATLPNPTRPVLEFFIDIPDQRDVKIKTVEVYKSFKRLGQPIGPRALSGSYTSFPATVSLTSQEALSGLQRLLFSTAPLPSLSLLLAATPSAPNTPNPISSGDAIIFTFEYVLEDGSRVILTPLTDVKLDGVGTPPARVISGTQINAPYALYGSFKVI
ncbi:hypothetical protein GCM10011495_01990 [Hymenobacter frigidus]|jgi:hypothetical protein|uniref:Lipoprotein n=1 Tax=Hymenobacter frigidus TaxID=1524095 RepID=A0ABQ1ZTI0_9BACT|nr:hypothetical protein [Hymenobacter frigidus]GGH78963.1 hypothetical protein GCM10011495_01990 [Hymenobacter frigidus]